MSRSFSILSLGVLNAAVLMAYAQPPVATPRPAMKPAAPISPSPPRPTGTATQLAATPGDTLIAHAATELGRHQAIAANLREQINLFGHQVFGKGTYLQQGRGENLKLRMEIKLEHVAGRTSSVQQVSDGTNFWLLQDTGGPPRISRIDLRRVRESLARQPSPKPQTASWLAIGGLPKLLDSLDRSFRFGPVRSGRLDRLDVWIIEGDWDRAALAELAPDQAARLKAGGPPDDSRLPEQIPNRVRLMVGRDDLFPYRIEYRRVSFENGQLPGTGDGALLVLMELVEVELNGPIDARNFIYQPTKYDDITATYLKGLGVSQETARAPAKAPGLAR